MENEKIDNTYSALSENDKQVLELIKTNTNKLHIIYRQFLFSLGVFILLESAILLFYFFFTKKTFLVTALTIGFSVLLCILLFFSLFLASIRLWWDKRKLINKIYEKFSNNFIIANFWNSTKRFRQELCLVKNDNTIILDNKGYLVNYEKVWLDIKKRPNLFYFENNAEPLSIDIKVSADTDSNSLKEYRETRFVSELLKENGNSNINVWLIIFGVIIIALLFFMVMKQSGNTQIIQNVSKVVK